MRIGKIAGSVGIAGYWRRLDITWGVRKVRLLKRARRVRRVRNVKRGFGSRGRFVFWTHRPMVGSVHRWV